VPLYRVSVYSASQMMWQSTTAELEASCPARTCDFRPGETYHWVVEALVGNTTLRSGAAVFTIAPADHMSSLARALTDADASVTDPRSAMALKVRLCLDSGAYTRALALLDQAIAAAPSRPAYALRAEVNSRMGLVEEALGDYRKALESPPGE
jgi:tetratricopeptide (TPR) repeat protein